MKLPLLIATAAIASAQVQESLKQERMDGLRLGRELLFADDEDAWSMSTALSMSIAGLLEVEVAPAIDPYKMSGSKSGKKPLYLSLYQGEYRRFYIEVPASNVLRCRTNPYGDVYLLILGPPFLYAANYNSTSREVWEVCTVFNDSGSTITIEVGVYALTAVDIQLRCQIGSGKSIKLKDVNIAA
ncbi:hypothetical protein ACHAXA_000532 [Cyclostephanos tholiformis]|uniref:Uncharacterized protein n=1 Tax=Cyclostephanos tholiformis TaxID=382380 RepID=A0ABD3SSR0_9STRA